MVNLQNITVAYGDNVVYKDFCCEFPRGVNVVLGKSGCGKTTLLNVIANLVKYDGECQKQGKTAIVFQEPCLAPVSVWKNIQAVLPKNSNEVIEKVLEAACIADKKNCNATRLSGGEQQRVSLARAFATDREILLLDEPFSDLDYGVKKQLHGVFDTLLSGKDKTVVLVTHDIDEAIALGDRIYLLQNKPCEIQKVAEIAVLRNERNEYSQENINLKKKLQILVL